MYDFPIFIATQVSLTIEMQIDGDGNFDSLTGMGFKVMHSFDEVSCDADTLKPLK